MIAALIALGMLLGYAFGFMPGWPLAIWLVVCAIWVASGADIGEEPRS